MSKVYKSVTVLSPQLFPYHRMLPQLLRELIIDQAIAPIKCTPGEEARAVNSSTHNQLFRGKTSGLAGGHLDGRATGSFSHAS